MNQHSIHHPCYVVTAYRWGLRDLHSYVVGVFTDMEKAKEACAQEVDYRGGKYGCEVIEAAPNDWRADKGRLPQQVFYLESPYFGLAGGKGGQHPADTSTPEASLKFRDSLKAELEEAGVGKGFVLSADWLRKMSEKEGNGIFSVGGLLSQLEDGTCPNARCVNGIEDSGGWSQDGSPINVPCGICNGTGKGPKDGLSDEPLTGGHCTEEACESCQ